MIEILSKKTVIDIDNEIREYYTENGNVRVLFFNGCAQSVMYTDENKHYKLFNNYLHFFNLPVMINPSISNYLMLGGGMFVYPQCFINSYPNKTITVVEKEKKYIELAKKYFYLNESLNKHPKNIIIINDDALKFIERNNRKYDCISIDLFDGRIPIKNVYSVFAITNLKKMLNEHGIITANYIVSKDNFLTYQNDLQRIFKLFKYYKIITDEENYDLKNNYGNIFLIMSDMNFEIPDNWNHIDLTRKIIN